MYHIYTTYLDILKNAFEGNTASTDVPQEYLPELAKLAEKQFSAPFVFPYMQEGTAFQILKQHTKTMLYHYYQIEHFTSLTAALLEKNNIPYFLMKGISLAAYYPMPEYRKEGDVDIYINEPEAFDRARQILEKNGYLPDSEVSSHHLTYTYMFPKTGRKYILELHFRIVGTYQYRPANQVIDTVYGREHLSTCFQIINGKTYRVLPPTEYTFYMIHHMLRHYLYSGFGIQLLSDFTLYVKKNEAEIDFEKIHRWCLESRISHLYEIILESCRLWLGLPSHIDADTHCDPKDCETFMEKILSGGAMGANEGRALVNSTSYQHINLLTYFKEGHHQMKVRFPKLGRCPILWPILWGITFVCFLYNTYHFRNTTFRQTLSDFKESNQNTKFIQIFDNSKDQK